LRHPFLKASGKFPKRFNNMNKMYYTIRFKEIAILMIFIVMTGHNVKAQSLKFGHINRDELIQAMPEFDSALVKIEGFRIELVNYLDLLSVELNNKYDTYKKNSKNLNEIVRQAKEQELNDLNNRIQEFQTNAQTQFQDKQAELFQPVYTKADRAIKAVGKENGFFYIFNTAQGDPLYFDETKSTDITALVKAKLKIL
jgi:outer membrane protein